MTADDVDIPVRGGALHARVRGPADAPAVLLVHGITSNLRFWDVIAARLDDDTERPVRSIAVDLRGRGRSAHLPGPSSMAGHAEDLVAVVDHLGVAAAPIAGHSMGGFVASIAAHTHPSRFPAVVLVDGGPPLGAGDPVPDDEVEAVLLATIGPSLERLERRFADRDAYRAFWRAHPAMAEVDTGWVHAYADHDLVADGAAHRSRVDRARVLEDGRDLLTSPDLHHTFTGLRAPSVFLRAERGMLDGPEGLYSRERLQEIRAAAPGLPVVEVADVNHFTIGVREPGVQAVVTAIRHAIAEA